MDRVLFFRELGFSEYESAVLSALVATGSPTAKEICASSGVPQNKIYAILEKFNKLGIISILSVEPKKYKLINIQTFASQKLKEEKKKIIELEKDLKNLEQIKDKEEQFTFTLIKGQKAIMNRLAEANKEAKFEIIGVQRNWKYWAEGIRAAKDAVKRGVNVRMIGIINEETKERAMAWKEVGCEIRKYNKMFGENPLRFSIIDSKYARITIGKPEIPNPDDYLTIWTDSKAMVSMLKNQFIQMWKSSERF